MKITGFQRSYYTYCCVRSLLHGLRRSRGLDGCCHPPLAVSAFTCHRSRNHWASGSMSMINALRTARTATERRKLYQNHHATVKSTRRQLTTETPLATRNGLVERRLKRTPAHFNTIFIKDQGGLRMPKVSFLQPPSVSAERFPRLPWFKMPCCILATRIPLGLPNIGISDHFSNVCIPRRTPQIIPKPPHPNQARQFICGLRLEVGYINGRQNS